MSVRRLAVLAVPFALALTGCPSVTQQPPPDLVQVAVFDPTTANIPLPNDLALQAAPGLPASAQKELLLAFTAAGGFPTDQEIPITVGLKATQRNADGTYSPTNVLPIDGSTVNASTVAIVRVDVSPPEVIAPEFGGFLTTPVSVGASTVNFGTLTIRRKADADGSRRWASSPGGGRYVVALRGGGNGIKTTSGLAIAADAPIALVAPNKNLTISENQPPGGLPAAEVAQLEGLRALYANPFPWCNFPVIPPGAPFQSAGWNPVGAAALAAACAPPYAAGTQAPSTPSAIAYAAIDKVFPHAELASIQTFGVDPSTHVLLDQSTGQVPVPSDFLIDPTTGRVRDLTAAVGPDAAQGLKHLDGFSTTAMVLAPLNGAIDATTVTRDNVLLFQETTGGAIWLQDLASALAIPDPSQAVYVSQPSAIVQSGASTTIGLQPAVPATVPTVGSFFLPPLEERTTYVVLVTDRVKDIGGRPLARGAGGDILVGTTEPLWTGPTTNPTSLIPGVSGPDAVGLQTMRDGLAPLLAGLPVLTGDATLTKDHVVMAYTFHTQSISGKDSATGAGGDPGILQLAALPYAQSLPDAAVAGSVQLLTPSTAVEAVFASFGIDTTASLSSSPVGTSNIGGIVTAKIITLDNLSPTTGAFIPPGDPNETPKPTPIDLLLVLPASPRNPGGVPTPIPLVIFHHGLAGSRGNMLLAADRLAAEGFAVAAIDAPKHGDRSYCNTKRSATNPNLECGPGAFCVTLGDQAGDPPGGGPGLCRVANDPGAALAPFQKRPIFCIDPSSCLGYLGQNGGAGAGVPLASSEYFISGNFFRVRDSFRQDVIDQSQLVRVVSPVAAPSNTDLLDALATYGVQIDPSQIYWAGQSLGSIEGTLNTAANPRISRAALNVGAAGLVDAFTNAPSFASQIAAIFAGLGIDLGLIQNPPPPSDPSYPSYLAQAHQYLLTLQVAKWIIDPADPVNFAKNLKLSPLPNLLANPDGSVLQAPKEVLAQAAMCDQTLPNPWNLLLAVNAGLSGATATPPSPPGALTEFQWFIEPNAPALAGCSSGGRVPHGFVLNYGYLAGSAPPFLYTPEADQADLQTLTGDAQSGIADFLSTGALQPNVVVP